MTVPLELELCPNKEEEPMEVEGEEPMEEEEVVEPMEWDRLDRENVNILNELSLE